MIGYIAIDTYIFIMIQNLIWWDIRLVTMWIVT